MKTKKVIVEPHNDQWKEEFEKIKSFLGKALKNLIIGIEHVGSTSVEGLAAKPIIDLDVIIEDGDQFDKVKRYLEGLGYRHEGDLGIKGREAFNYSKMSEFMAHHLYVCTQHSVELKRHLTFRDYLRTHKEEMERYGAVKLEAAKKFPNDIDGYIAYKSACIEEIFRKCGL